MMVVPPALRRRMPDCQWGGALRADFYAACQPEYPLAAVAPKSDSVFGGQPGWPKTTAIAAAAMEPPTLRLANCQCRLRVGVTATATASASADLTSNTLRAPSRYTSSPGGCRRSHLRLCRSRVRALFMYLRQNSQMKSLSSATRGWRERLLSWRDQSSSSTSAKKLRVGALCSCTHP